VNLALTNEKNNHDVVKRQLQDQYQQAQKDVVKNSVDKRMCFNPASVRNLNTIR
jgi:hypothetical protein